MRRPDGYLFMKLFARHRSDPITDALNGSLPADPSVVAFTEQLLAAAGKEESVLVSPPMDTIIDVVTSGSGTTYDDLLPAAKNQRGRRLARLGMTAGLASKLLFGAAAIAAVTTTAAVTGTLPDAVQDFVSDSVDNVGVEIPRGTETTSPPSTPAPRSPVSTPPTPAEQDEYQDAVKSHNTCVQDARSAFADGGGNASEFDAAEACGERPDPKNFGGSEKAKSDKNNPSDTRPPKSQGGGSSD